MSDDEVTRPMCRHCGREPACRPRGLGWSCYKRPEVRCQYEPVSSEGRRGVDPPEMPTCWVCGIEATRQSHLGALGWQTRVIPIPGGRCREVLCPECFAKEGWVDWEAHLKKIRGKVEV